MGIHFAQNDISHTLLPVRSHFLPVRNFTWNDLPALLEFVGKVQAKTEHDRKFRQQDFKETLGLPGLEPEENCLLLEEEGQIQGGCLIFPELPISRAVLALDVAPDIVGGPSEGELLRRAVERCREMGAQVAHICLGHDSPRNKLLEKEGFHLARVYWDMLWQHETVPEVEPPAGFTIRSFQPGDAEALTEVQNAAFSGSWGFSPNTLEQIEYRSSMSNTPHQGILFLVNGDRVAAYCWTHIAPANGKTRGIIGMIGVAPDYRGLGVSKPILSASMGYLKSIRVDDIGLHVDGNNAPAIRLYASMGFSKVGELHWYGYKFGN
jgi:mycothiol synthase